MEVKLEKLMVLVAVLVMGLISDVANADMVAHWKLDEMSGSIANDNSGNGHTGTLHGAPKWRADGGQITSVLEFDGIDDYVEITGYKGITGTHSRTVSAWIKTMTGGGIIYWGEKKIWRQRVITGKQWILWVQHNGMAGVICLMISNGEIKGDTNVCDGVWHHVAAVLEDDGSPSVNEIKLYVDGRPEKTNSDSSLAINTGEDIDVTIGVLTYGRYFKGLIGEVAIFDQALSEDEIAELYNRSRAWFNPEPALLNLFNKVREAEAIVKEQGSQEMIISLEKKIAEYEKWREENPGDVGLPYKLLSSDLYFLLAKAREAAGYPKKNIAAAYKGAIFSPEKKGLGRTALTWLFENMPTKDYIAAVKKCVHSSNVTSHNIHYIAKNFESSGNWPAFELFLDVVFSEAEDSVAFAKSVERGLGKNGIWEKKYLGYCRGKTRLMGYVFGKDREVAEKYVAEENFKKAAKVYKDTVKLYGPGRYKSVLESKVCECLFKGGEYQSAISALDWFIAKNKATNRSLVKEAILMKGQCYIQLGEIDRASDEFLTLTAEYPEAKQTPNASFFIGYCYMLQDRFEEATDALNLVVQEYPKSSYASKARMYLARIENMID